MTCCVVSPLQDLLVQHSSALEEAAAGAQDANMPHTRQSSPDSGLAFQEKVVARFEVVPCWLLAGGDASPAPALQELLAQHGEAAAGAATQHAEHVAAFVATEVYLCQTSLYSSSQHHMLPHLHRTRWKLTSGLVMLTRPKRVRQS